MPKTPSIWSFPRNARTSIIGMVAPMTYVLHFAPDNASLIVRLALEEMGLPYRAQLVDRRLSEQQSTS